MTTAEEATGQLLPREGGRNQTDGYNLGCQKGGSRKSIPKPAATTEGEGARGVTRQTGAGESLPEVFISGKMI